MKIRIVSYEDVNRWILGKFAMKLREELIKSNVAADISHEVRMNADINHHITTEYYDGKHSTINTIMITHIDTIKKKNKLQKQLKVAKIGICMSRETMDNLANFGIPRDKLCYVNPAHDEVIKPRSKVVGITCRVQPDGRKREHFLAKLARQINPKDFSFKIMGDGWGKYVDILRDNGFNVEYWDHFNYEKYIKLIPQLDYYLYMAEDEGQMGFIDAAAAGIQTIVTPQGYHLDAKPAIAYQFNTLDELISIFNQISTERQKVVNSVSNWTWANYAKKHIEIWNYVIAQSEGRKYAFSHSDYDDGINSISEFDTHALIKFSKKMKLKKLYKLYVNKALLRRKIERVREMGFINGTMFVLRKVLYREGNSTAKHPKSLPNLQK